MIYLINKASNQSRSKQAIIIDNQISFHVQSSFSFTGIIKDFPIIQNEKLLMQKAWREEDEKMRFDINKKVYPQDLVGQVHADGEIIAGSFWDLYLLLGNMQQIINLFKETFEGGDDLWPVTCSRGALSRRQDDVIILRQSLWRPKVSLNKRM